MGKYVEKSLYENELIVEKAQRDNWALIGCWVLNILIAAVIAVGTALLVQFTEYTFLSLLYILLLFPIIAILKNSIIFTCTELVLTNKRIIRKSGVFHTKAFDAPLDKIQNVYVETTFWGRVFNSNLIRITTVHGIIVDRICNAEQFKTLILSQMEHYDEFRYSRQADWTAQALAGNKD